MDDLFAFKKLLVIIAICSCFNIFAAGKDFFKYQEDRGRLLPSNKLYPQGRLFPFSGYSPHPKDYKKLQSAKFTALGPVYNESDKLLKSCEKLKMQCIYHIQPYFANKKKVEKTDLSDDKTLDWKWLASNIANVVKNNAANPNIAWWVFAPEELRYWRKNEYKYFRDTVKIIRKNDPLKRPIFFYNPGHYSAEALTHYAKDLDIIGKGCYVNYSGQKKNRIWVRWSIEQEIKAIKESKSVNSIPILVPEMFQEPSEKEKGMIPDWVRHDVYCGLIAGAKGVLIFSLWPRAKFPSHETYLNSYCKIATELNKKNGLGQVFLFGTKMNDIKMNITSGPAGVSCNVQHKINNKYNYSSIPFSNIAYKKARYLIAVNSSSNHVNVEFAGFPKKLQTFDALSGKKLSSPVNGKFKTIFKPYEVKAYKYQQ